MPERVAFVYDSLHPHVLGGAARYYATLAAAVARQVPVTLVTSRFPAAPSASLEGVEVIGVAPPPKPGAIARKLLFAAGVFLHLLRHGRRYTVVHCACFPQVALIAARLGLLAHPRTKLVADWHEVIPRATWRRRRGRLGELGNLVQALALRCGDIAITFSELHRRRLEERRAADTVFVLPEFLPEIDPPALDASGERENVILFIGRLVKEKHAELVPYVVRELRLTDPSWRGVVFGAGPDERDVAGAVQDARQADAVTLAGAAPWEEISSMMRRARCLVFPTEREGFGLVVLEAAAHGLPTVLVAGDDNAAIELIEAGRNGLVCADADPRTLAAAVRELAADPGIHSRARDWFDDASRRHSVENAVRELLELDGLSSAASSADTTGR